MFRVVERAVERVVVLSMKEIHKVANERQVRNAVLRNLLNQYNNRMCYPRQRAYYTWHLSTLEYRRNYKMIKVKASSFLNDITRIITANISRKYRDIFK